MRDRCGNRRDFDGLRHAAFQSILQDYGDPEFYALKQRVIASVAAGDHPTVVRTPSDRFARTIVRVTLRQLEAANGVSPSLTSWLAADEPADRLGGEEPDSDHG